MMIKTDTIAAVATAMGSSGIGIIRISGKNALAAADAIYRGKKDGSLGKRLENVKSHTIHYGFIYDGNELVDEVMVSVMRAPNSYTTEDTVEINCHGGIFILNKILALVLKNGVRLAGPGEFTKRAFLNGRIDLSRAEAVMDLIQSKNEFALQSSLKQLKGSVFSIVKELREEILYEIALIESALDDPEHMAIEGYSDRILPKLNAILSRLEKLIASSDNGRILKEGIHTVIVGKPNAGKSSLLNVLLGEERAIVTDIAGTTRDTLEESVMLGGISLNIIDTAGIRPAKDAIEKIGIEKAKRCVKDADLILYVLDASVHLDENDRDILSLICQKNMIILLNKTDLPTVITKEMAYREIEDIFLKENIEKKDGIPFLEISAKENTGIDALGQMVKEMFFHGEISSQNEIFITNMRHKEAMKDAYESLLLVKKSIEDGMPEDFLSIDLMGAYAHLGTIIGEKVEDDLVNKIFSEFCMGK